MNLRLRRLSVMSALVIGTLTVVLAALPFDNSDVNSDQISEPVVQNADSAQYALEQLAVKGRAPKTGYQRSQFGSGWKTERGCSMRHIILFRDVQGAVIDDKCRVVGGVLHDPYTLKYIDVASGSSAIQIDHVVALSDAWQKGAQALTYEQRTQLANDPLNLLAVDGDANQQKGDGDAATWLPPNKAFRCEYVARQVAVKRHYHLWVTAAEKDAINRVLSSCPNQSLPMP